MFSDFKFIAYWWLVHLIFGLVSLPFITQLFSRFYDRGYIFSKIFSISLVTYLLLVGSILRLIPFNLNSIYLCLGLVFLISYIKIITSREARHAFIGLVRHLSKYFIVEEIAFFLVLTLWAFVRGFNPELESLEKFMDWGFVNSALRSPQLPPGDMWYAQSPINYYYFGHLSSAVLTRFSTLPSYITYNLSIASIAALTFTAAFSLASNIFAFRLSKQRSPKSVALSTLILGFTTAVIVTFGGNLHPVFKITKNYLSESGSLLKFDQTVLNNSINRYWYPDATRFIGFDPDTDNKTIHEFPIYSFVVADLHGHMNGIPNVLMLVSIYFALLLANIFKPKSTPSYSVYDLAFIGLLLSIAYMTNAWDIAVYGLLFAVVTFFSFLGAFGLWRSIVKTIVYGLSVLVLWYLYTLPFSLNFIPMAEGLRWVDARSSFYQLFVLYGGFWIVTAPLMLYIGSKLIKRLFRSTSDINPIDIFIFSLLVLSTILIIVPEIFYIKDIYVFEHRRANTMFKLVYQAFILYSLTLPYCLYRASRFITRRPLKLIYLLLSILVISSHLIYPYFAIKSNYGNRPYVSLTKSTKFFEETYPEYWQVITWLNRNVSDRPTIVEAVGDSYTHYNQVSMATGLPTIQGWLVHEWLWRGGFEGPGARAEEVKEIYESVDTTSIRSILDKYQVKYIIVGKLEKEKYLSLDEDKFIDLGATVAFTAGDTKVYQIAR
jgi:uncharacterized membrane protein